MKPLLISAARRISRKVDHCAARRVARPCGDVSRPNRTRTAEPERVSPLLAGGMVEPRTQRVMMWHVAPPLGRHHHAEAARGRVGPDVEQSARRAPPCGDGSGPNRTRTSELNTELNHGRRDERHALFSGLLGQCSPLGGRKAGCLSPVASAEAVERRPTREQWEPHP